MDAIDTFIAVSRRDVILLLKTVFSTLTVAMRFEPANAKFFATEVSDSFLCLRKVLIS